MWMFIYAVIVIVVSFVGLLAYLNIHNFISYRKRLRHEEEVKSRCKDHLRKTAQIVNQMKEMYPEYVYITIRAKTQYITGKVSFLNLDRQERYFKRLYDMTYETQARLQADFYNVAFIIAPLNNLAREIDKTLGK